MKLYHSTNAQKVQNGLMNSTMFFPEYIHVFDYVSLQPILPIEQPNFVLVSSKRAVDWLTQQEQVLVRLQEVPFFVVGETSFQKLSEHQLAIQGFSNHGVREILGEIPNAYGWFIGAKHPVQFTQNWIDTTSTIHIACYEQLVQPIIPRDFDSNALFLLTSPNIIRRYKDMGMIESAQIVVLGESSLEIALELGYKNVRVSPYQNVTRTVCWLTSHF